MIPARGGSKGIPKKNLKKIMGKSLIQIVSECVLNTKYIDEAIISSDDHEIIDEAKKFGLKAHFVRPKEHSGDNIGDVPVLKHALIETEKKKNCIFDIVLMLQPTAPLRTPSQIEKVIIEIISKNFETVWTVHKVDDKYHPDKQLKLNEKGNLEFFTKKGKDIISRQELSDSYMKNGIAYAITRQFLIEKEQILGFKNGSVILSGPIANIDTIDDLVYAEKIISKNCK